jgi:hypothetical protein
VLALGQDVDLGLLDGVPGLEVTDGVVKVDANMMTGHAGIFAGGDMVPAERNVTVASGTARRRREHRRLAARHGYVAPPPKHAVATFEKLNTWYYADAPKTVRPMLDIIRRRRPSTKCRAGSTRAPRCSKRAAACRAATASSATTATASARTTR